MNIVYRPIDKWPGEPTKVRRDSPFQASWASTLDLLDRELFHLNAKDIVFQIALREEDFRKSDGQPKVNSRASHPGVVLAFNSKYGPLKYATDTFHDFQANVRAIALGLEALRKVDRYGITKRGEQYTGWKAIPATTGPTKSVASALEWLAEQTSETAANLAFNEERIRWAYRVASRKLHPDMGGTDDSFAVLGDVYRMLMTHYGFKA